MVLKKVVAGIVDHYSSILITKSNTLFDGEWHIPLISLKENETDAYALIRGIKEKTGLDIRIGSYLGSKDNISWYICFSESNGIRSGTDIKEAKLVNKCNIPKVCGEKTRLLWPYEVKEFLSR